MNLEILLSKRYIALMRKENSPAIRRSAAPRPAALRSKVTNGKSLFVRGGDGRGAWARRLRDALELHVSDLGGPNNISEAERSIYAAPQR